MMNRWLHIRRDGGLLCGEKIYNGKGWRSRTEYEKFSKIHAYKSTDHICGKCLDRYYEILDNMDSVIVVED